MSAQEQPVEAVGAIVAGRFRIERSLGEGGMAEVFQAHDLAAQRPVAIKLLKKDIADNPEAIERLRREAQVLERLDHPAVVKLETFGKLDDGRLFIAMEMLKGETLGDRMRREGKLDPADLSPVVAGACAGLAAAHDAGIVHRDLKPDNIFLEEIGDGMQVKLLDFGISKVTGSDKLTQTGEVLGTPRYMAPEQLSAERDLDGRTDVYAMGVILYEALAGSPPFIAATPTDLIVAILHGKAAPLRSFRPDLAGDVETVVTRSMSKAREARYGDARELADAWLSAAGTGGVPVAEDAVASPREGMRTAPLGSLGEEASALVAREGERQDDVRPGTFSALAATDPAADRVPVVDAAAAPVVVQADVAEPRNAEPPADVAPAEAGSTVPAKQSARPVAAPARARREERTGDYKLPTSGGRTLLIVAGIVAGMLSAAVAIALVEVLSDDDGNDGGAAAPSPAESPPAAELTPVASDEPEGAGGAALGAEPVTDVEADVEADGAEADGEPAGDADDGAAEAGDEAETGAAGGSSADTPARRRAPRSRRARRPSASAATAAPSQPAAAADTPAALMGQARQALRDGDPARCVEIVDRAIRAGAPSTSLRLRGDCLVRAGDRSEAVKAYERFCRLAPDHPAISEVRAVVEGLGGRCN